MQRVNLKNGKDMNFLQKLLTDGGETALPVTEVFKKIAYYGQQTGETLGSEVSDRIDAFFDKLFD